MDSVTRGQVAPRAPWSIEDSEQIYSAGSWGSGYFGINAAGHVVCRPGRDSTREIDLYEVVRELEARDLTAPMVLRFSDILRDRLRSLHDAFASAIAENDYKNRYAAVFPIKVNQQRLRRRGGLPRQRGPRIRARGRQQARAPRGDGDDRRRRRSA